MDSCKEKGVETNFIITQFFSLTFVDFTDQKQKLLFSPLPFSFLFVQNFMFFFFNFLC